MKGGLALIKGSRDTPKLINVLTHGLTKHAFEGIER